MDDEALYEVIDGVRVELPVSAENVFLANELSYHVSAFARPRNLGRSVVEILVELPLPDRSRIRRPDMAFVSFDRWPRTRPLPTQGNSWPVAPDLAVEFVSPSETGDEIIEKLRDYFDAGVRCVWVIYTHHRYVLEFESLTHVRGLTEADELDGKDFLPGFRIPVSSLFQPRG
jgi:Uma2 family endonuclease